MRSQVFLLTTFPVEILFGDNKLLLVLLLACDILLVHNNWLSEETGVPLVHEAALVMPHMDEDRISWHDHSCLDSVDVSHKKVFNLDGV